MSSSVKECIKTIRLTHRTLIGVCGAVAIFSLSSDHSRKQKLQREVANLQEEVQNLKLSRLLYEYTKDSGGIKKTRDKIQDAIKLIHEKQKELSKCTAPVSLLGLRIDGQTMTYVGPASILLLLLILFCHVKYYFPIAINEGESSDNTVFIGWMRGWLAFGSFFLTTTIFPVGLMLYCVFLNEMSNANYIGKVIVTVLSLVGAIFGLTITLTFQVLKNNRFKGLCRGRKVVDSVFEFFGR